jgi:hypothetical protein
VRDFQAGTHPKNKGKTQNMTQKTLCKLGAAGAILGAVITQASGIMHPVETSDLFNASLHVPEVAANNTWVYVYFGFTVGFILLFTGLIAIAESIKDEPAASWAKIALGLAGASTALSLIFFVLDGFSMKVIAVALVAAGNDPAALAASAAVDRIGRAYHGMWTFFTWGLTPLVYGITVFKSNAYPKWIGFLPMLGGTVALVTGAIILINDFTLGLLPPFYISILLFNVFMIIMGVMLWKKASAE